LWARDALNGHDKPNGRRSDEEAVVIVNDGGSVAVVGDGEHAVKPVAQKILPIKVQQSHCLAPRPKEPIEPAVGVLFQHRKEGKVELVAVGFVVAEKANAGLVVHEQKAPKVGVETLNACPQTGEVVIRAQAHQPLLGEQIVHAEVGVKARLSAPNIHIHDIVLAGRHIVEVDDRRGAEEPVAGSVGRVALVKVKAKAQSFANRQPVHPRQRKGCCPPTPR
jgi:hypothetical protein